jgi:CBS domain containing-hemolysin-like protein
MTALELFACVVLGAVSSWLSASEIALFSLSRFQLRSLKERFRGAHRKIKRLLADPTGLLITLLAANEVVNVGLSSIIAQSLARWRRPDWVERLPIPHWALSTLLGLLISTPIVLLLCDVTPKIVGSRANRLIAPATAGPLSVLYDVFKPVRVVLAAIVARVAAWTSPRSERHRAARGAEGAAEVTGGRAQGGRHPAERARPDQERA